jgi:hypothetical protein
MKFSLPDEVIIFLSEESDFAFWINFKANSSCFDSLSKLTQREYSLHTSSGNWSFAAIESSRGVILPIFTYFRGQFQREVTVGHHLGKVVPLLQLGKNRKGTVINL